MLDFLIAGVLTAAGFLVVITKIWGITKVLYWEPLIDFGFTLMLPLLMMGSYSGMMTAIFAGLTLSLFLKTYRYYYRLPNITVLGAYKRWKEGKRIHSLRKAMWQGVNKDV